MGIFSSLGSGRASLNSRRSTTSLAVGGKRSMRKSFFSFKKRVRSSMRRGRKLP